VGPEVTLRTEHTILLVTRDKSLIGAVSQALDTASEYRIIFCETEAEASQRLNDVDIHMILCDAEVIKDVAANFMITARIAKPMVSRVLFSCGDDVSRVTEIARTAAVYLYLMKPTPVDLIALVVKRALELGELSRRHRVLSRDMKFSMDDGIFNEGQEFAVKGGYSQFELLIYESQLMAELAAEAKQAAKTDLPVLIHGETGTGKELLARAIHFNSPRMNSPMLVQNCGGMGDETLHSELFGHVRGAFTGAVSDRLGLFRAGDNGTVFLDEISDISPSFQVSLLRFLQEGEVKPLGSDKIQTANVRIIAASNRRLDELVEAGEFRRDLYYRLKGFELSIPPLRERPTDVPALVQFFIEKYGGVVGRQVVGIAKDALAKLMAYDYPGNVRELETEVRRMVAVAENGGYITSRHLSPAILKAAPAERKKPEIEVTGASLKEMVEALESQVVSEMLNRYRWNQSRAAEELGLSRVGLANKIKRYRLQDI